MGLPSAMSSLFKIVYHTGIGFASVLSLGRVSFVPAESISPNHELVGVRGIMADAYNLSRDSRQAQHLALGDHIQKEKSRLNVKRGKRQSAGTAAR